MEGRDQRVDQLAGRVPRDLQTNKAIVIRSIFEEERTTALVVKHNLRYDVVGAMAMKIRSAG